MTNDLSIAVGSTLRDRYEILHCIARQRFSTIWMARDAQLNDYVALKVQSPDKPVPTCGCADVAKAIVPTNEDEEAHPGRTSLPILLDSFALESAPGKPEFHCLVTPLLGQSITTMCHDGSASLPWDVVKRICIFLLFALDYLHNVKGVIHTDIHPDNILIQPTERNGPAAIASFLKNLDPKADPVGPVSFPVGDVRDLAVSLADLETAHLMTNRDKHDFVVQPHHLRAPEVILGAQWGPPADIWSLGCLIHEWATCSVLFAHDTVTGNPQQILAHMVQVLGNFPPELVQKGRWASGWFNDDGSMKIAPERIGSSLMFGPLIAYNLFEAPGYRPPLPEIDELELGKFIHFLSQMLCLDPEKRWSAIDLVKHPWLFSTFTQYYHDMVKAVQERVAAEAAVADSSGKGDI
ncbi:uncharacterized protein PHACADRAFT_203897 [Phanerochaete carnosa HHB-10118-sp]|uniref:non-specific serine/threonine protein kinase n=1 Tax=Phanerochaete carnosa (strain HHB-10118-sp) TaxID=650164 RepID=K5W9W6_PHACS|nr:uncharacterized protein PHACADRAFT_203897 [Phanerochaete carnosa HHB-10118-sp]EKM60748.1 hypothetical protein PHACADRAFT_203897 [Phanerochaete carnosa HHB-10118-sp]